MSHRIYSAQPGAVKASHFPEVGVRDKDDAMQAIRDLMPQGAWDAHFHTLHAPGTDHHYPVEAARALHRSIGIERGVIVQSLLHGATHEDFVASLESAPEWRGVASLNEAVTEPQLDRLHAAGARAIRLTHVGFLDRKLSVAAYHRAEQRAAERGWHLLLHLEPETLLEFSSTIAKSSVPVVIDHCAHIDSGRGIDQPAFKMLLELHRLPHCWAKLSSLDRWAPSGPPHYAEAVDLGRAVLANAPERVLWATDWPHVMYRNPRNPIDAPPQVLDLMRLLFALVGDDHALLRRMLVDNPERLYG